MSKEIAKPWGKEKVLYTNRGHQIKLLYVKQYGQLSHHYHRFKDEIFFILKGNGTFERSGENIWYGLGSFFRIRPMTLHRIHAWKDTTVLEIARNVNSKVEDVIRLEDAYGRVKKNRKLTNRPLILMPKSI